ncbi:MAG: hypothetical protein GF331_22390, partial [Chitinivibrionales bacterium]|nr:hypothetical protein [Chitinivibrionales bacterium]
MGVLTTAMLMTAGATPMHAAESVEPIVVATNVGGGGGTAEASFQVDLANGGQYYVGAWVNGLAQSSIDVRVNGDAFPVGYLALSRDGWQSAVATDPATPRLAQKVKFKPGTNTIVFSQPRPAVPCVASVRIGKTLGDVGFDQGSWDAELSVLRSTRLPVEYETVRSSLAFANEVTEGPAVELVEAAAAGGGRPPLDYRLMLQAQTHYTAQFSYYIDGGQTVTVETRNSTTDPILCMFYRDDISVGSWADDNSGSGYEARLVVTAPTTGVYNFVAFSYSAWYQGACDI